MHRVTDQELTTIVFDLGAVLIDWDPRYVYRDLFPGDEPAMEAFLADVTSATWNHQMDAGKPWADAVAELVQVHPERRELIEAYWSRWAEMLHGEIPGTVAILARLRGAGPRLFALTNWSAETFPVARERFPFLGLFDAIVISGQERISKPDPRLFRVLFDRCRLDPRDAVFVDDAPRNVEVAAEMGMHALHFTGPGPLRTALEALGLLGRTTAPAA